MRRPVRRSEPGARGGAYPGTRNILLTLWYDGTAFKGWQRLGPGSRTVQGALEDALAAALGEPANVVGSGRTDAGVHAEGQAANFWTSSGATPAELAAAVERALPADLGLVSAREALSTFHARYRAVSKTYAYRFLDGPAPDEAERPYSLRVPRRLDAAAMSVAARAFLGAHDFSSFTNRKPDGGDRVRTVSRAVAERRGGLVEVRFTADGFLYNQARIMAGALLEVGLGRLDAEGLGRLLAAGSRQGAPGAAGAFGLRLVCVEYRESDFAGPATVLPETPGKPRPPFMAR